MPMTATNSFEWIDFEMELPGLRNRKTPDEMSNLTAARNDRELAVEFVQRADWAPATLIATKADLCRFLWWCADAGISLSDIRTGHLKGYKDFLLDPQPRERWVSESAYKPGEHGYKANAKGTKWKRTDPRWRPFSGPLSPASARQTFRVARALLTFGRDVGYLRSNAAPLVKNFKKSAAAKVTRFLGTDAVHYIDEAIAALPAETTQQRRAKARDQFLFVTFRTTGARLSEVVTAKMDSIFRNEDGRWWLTVIGKGSKVRDLPVTPEMLDCFRRYREAFELDGPNRMKSGQVPLVGSLRRVSFEAVGAGAVGNAIVKLFSAAVDLAKADENFNAARKLSEATTHWLRHQMITDLVNHKNDVIAGRDQAGHKDIGTTSTYLHKDPNERHNNVLDAMADIRTYNRNKKRD